MDKIRVSVVSYLNSQVFIYGLEHGEVADEIILYKDIPSVCAQRLIEREADIGLVPVAILPQLPGHEIITDTCIGTNGKVNSVMLYSDLPIGEVKQVMLDFHSRTSVALVQILAKNYWKINPQFIAAQEGFIDRIGGGTAAVVIGDRTFTMGNKFKYVYDLADAWTNFTGLPFVFACWVANKNTPVEFIKKFERSLQMGLDHKNLIIDQFEHLNNAHFNVRDYLEKNIEYALDKEKIKGMELFLSYLPNIS